MILLLWSMGLLCLSAALSFVVSRSPIGARLGPVFCVMGCLLEFVAAFSTLISTEPATFTFEWSLTVGRFGLLLDPLASLFLLPVFRPGALHFRLPVVRRPLAHRGAPPLGHAGKITLPVTQA